MGKLHQSPIRSSLEQHRLSSEQRAYFQNLGAELADTVCVLGPMPLIKNKLNGILRIDDYTVLNSDNENSNTPIPTPVKFVLGYEASIRIGSHCDLNGASITAYDSVTIGHRVQIAAGGLITDTDFHPIDVEARRLQLEGKPYSREMVSKRPVVIEDDVWLGYGVLVLKGVHIGRGSIIGAGSVVTRNVPPFVVAAGNPAVIVKNLAPDFIQEGES